MHKTGLFFGSFNPLHIGHLIIAGYMKHFTDLEEVWLVVSPQNPLKPAEELLDGSLRLEMVRLAIENDPDLQVCDVEFRLPLPSYTWNTLQYLKNTNPDKEFVIITGSDIFEDFHRWKNYRQLLKSCMFYVYLRPGSDPGVYTGNPSIRIFQAPLLDISSTFIRNSIRQGKDVRYMVPEKVWKFICGNGLYR